MAHAMPARTPAHLWIVGILSLVWNAFGGVDYTMTRLRNTDYLASMMPGIDPQIMLDWVDSFPLWVQFGWGLGVWGGVLGAVMLLMRSRWAVPAFAASVLGAVISLGYQMLAAPPPAGLNEGAGAVMPFVIIAVAAAQLYYAMRQRAKGVLR